ncbi:hypothetical protein [Streptomyces sp. NPDC007205]|uniref:hypothetical protein n=1 Tax=Streptomyces sp. NPDC007205 TaxID=3154316 RepID=UPI0033F829DD
MGTSSWPGDQQGAQLARAVGSHGQRPGDIPSPGEDQGVPQQLQQLGFIVGRLPAKPPEPLPTAA